jgi:hypothetical protein
MQTEAFEKILQEIDPRVTIVPNKNRPGLSNVLLSGKDICPVPSDIIKEDTDPSYTYTFPNGMMARHKSQKEVISQLNTILEYIKTDEGKDVFFN